MWSNCQHLEAYQKYSWALDHSIFSFDFPLEFYHTEPDKSIIEQACSEIVSLAFDIDDFPAAKCEKDSFWKDQKILENVCARLQNDYNFLEPETLQQAFKELKSKLDSLKSKWEFFKEEKANSRKNFY